jgi:dimethylhistidine N-methyltransferase
MLGPRTDRRPQHHSAGNEEFAAAILDGLSRSHKTLPCRFFYDARGSELFEEITRLPEYYPTRTETAILEQNAREMTSAIPSDGVLMEFGSGSSLKTEILLQQLPQLSTYVMIDVSSAALHEAKTRLAARFRSLEVLAIVGDFSRPIALPPHLAKRHKTGFFPGSTIGNLTHPEASHLLRVFQDALSPGGRLIVGVDLKKDARTLVRAYDDAAGVTATFNLNLLARINRELGGTFDLAAFKHKAVYNPREGRVEMHLQSVSDQVATVCGRRFRFGAGERIHTENSYKYTLGEFEALARSSNWLPQRVWTDRNGLFSVHELVSR